MESRVRLHLLIAALLLSAVPAGARVLLTQKDALALAFPAGTYERRTAYLTEEQRASAQKLGRVKVDSQVWTYYAGPEGTAWFETHVVRTMPETFMAVVGHDGKLKFVELLAFAEPDFYLPRPRWLDQFKEKGLEDELYVRRAIRNVTGASLTSQALTEGVRRILAVHKVVQSSK